jgi:hypothetical protein
MPDPDQPDKSRNEPRLVKPRRRAPVIDLKAEPAAAEPASAETAAPGVPTPGPASPGAPAVEAQPQARTTPEASPGAAGTSEAEAQPVAAPESSVSAAVAAKEAAPQTEPEPATTKAAEPQPEAAPRPQEPLRLPPEPEPQRLMTMPLAAAALAGLIFGGIGGMVAPSLLGGSDGASVARLDILDRMQQQLARDQAGLASKQDLDKLRQAVAALEGGVAQRPASATGGEAAGASELEPRIAALEASLKELADRPAPATPAAPPAVPPAPAAPPVDLGPLQARLTELDQRIAALGGLEGRLGGLDGQMKGLDEQIKVIGGEVKTLGEQLSAVDGRAAAAAQAAQAATGAAQAATGAAQAATGAAQAATGAAQAAASAADPKLAALGQRLDQATAQIVDSRAAPLFSAAQALSQAFHRGAPFTAELAAAEALGAKPEQLAPLRPFAERGAPTAQRLLESFLPLAGKLSEDAGQPGAWGYVSRFVTVRPTGETAGDSPPAIVGSIEAALKRGDVAAAHAAWARLPETARNASSAWGKQVAERAAAAKALADLQAAAATALRK